MSWISTHHGILEDEAVKSMRFELEKQQQIAENMLIEKQRKKEEQLLQKQRRRKEQQSIRQDGGSSSSSTTTTNGQQQEQKKGRKRKNTLTTMDDDVSSLTTSLENSSSPSSTSLFMHLLTSSSSSSTSSRNLIPSLNASISNSDLTTKEELIGYNVNIESNNTQEIDKKRNDNLVDRKSTLLELSRFQCEYASDEDTIETDYYEPLAHCEYFTKEEVIRLYGTKLKHLKSMYSHQLEFIKLAWKEKRRVYLQTADELLNSNVSYSSDPKILIPGKDKITKEYIDQQTNEKKRSKQLIKYQHLKGSRAAVRMRAKLLYEESQIKEKLKTQREYEKKYKYNKSDELKDGVVVGDNNTEKIDMSDSDDSNENNTDDDEDLFELFKEARQSYNQMTLGVVGEGNNKGSFESSSSTNQICTWRSDDEINCSHPALPLTKYCHSHILHDEKQILYKSCGRPVGNNDTVCQIPVLGLIDRLGCQTHRIPLVKEPLEPHIKKKERIIFEANLPIATPEDETKILEDLVSNETYNINEYDEAIKYIEKKGLRSIDTDDSDEEDEMLLSSPIISNDDTTTTTTIFDQENHDDQKFKI